MVVTCPRRLALSLCLPLPPKVRDAFAGRHGEAIFKVVTMDAASQPYATVPCSVCSVTADCREGGDICPSKCEYIERWLNQATDLSW